MRSALRVARDDRGLTQSQVAEAMEWSLSKIMRIESGEVTVSPTDLRRLLPYLGIAEHDRIEQLVSSAKASRSRKAWWADPKYRNDWSHHLRMLVQYEAEAVALRHFSVMLIPGLLQIPEYAATVMRGLSDAFSLAEHQTRLDFRLRRQQEMLSREDFPSILVLLDESVLYREVGGPDVMARQLEELLRYMKRGAVMVRILPFAKAAPVALLGPFIIVDLQDLKSVFLYRESHTGDGSTEDPSVVSQHRHMFDRMWDLAIDEEASAALISRRVKEMFATVRCRE
ncbi:MAG: helix-turn-helix domain-containing protein [Micromonosporaceae bacterium]|nr:helix-turn-helix domain-containing protein [Micromonosporaceae bacterium]